MEGGKRGIAHDGVCSLRDREQRGSPGRSNVGGRESLRHFRKPMFCGLTCKNITKGLPTRPSGGCLQGSRGGGEALEDDGGKCIGRYQGGRSTGRADLLSVGLHSSGPRSCFSSVLCPATTRPTPLSNRVRPAADTTTTAPRASSSSSSPPPPSSVVPTHRGRTRRRRNKKSSFVCRVP
jgi:hypothetical protein